MNLLVNQLSQSSSESTNFTAATKGNSFDPPIQWTDKDSADFCTSMLRVWPQNSFETNETAKLLTKYLNYVVSDKRAIIVSDFKSCIFFL